MLKVASYCRVSTDKEDQANSFESQQRYFREYISRQPDWELYEVYADEGITGTSTRKRAAFNRMICDAYMGKFQLILTKEVSRFSRNILDTIAYTRELKQLGIGVLFMNDAIHTLEPDAELRLSIMASIAQEESRKTSSRVKWGQTRQMEQGVVFGRSLLGYNVRHGVLTIEPEGAALVRLIFQKYGVEKKGTAVIARELQEAGYTTSRGNPKWSGSHILKILKNEKYIGDLVQKKSITPDYLTHSKRRNHGEEALVILHNHHAPIIDRALWNTVQEEIQVRNRHGTPSAGHSNRYVFSGKIRCGVCGASFSARKRKRKDGSEYRYWSCSTAIREGRRHEDIHGNSMGCDLGQTIRDELAMDMLRQVLASLRFDREQLILHVTGLAMDAIQAEEAGPAAPKPLALAARQLLRQKEAALDAFFAGSISRETLQQKNKQYEQALEALQGRMEAIKTGPVIQRDQAVFQEELIRHISAIFNGGQGVEIIFKNLLERMTVFQNGRIEVQLHSLPHRWCFLLESQAGIEKQCPK